jgi:hypothetical protein
MARANKSTQELLDALRLLSAIAKHSKGEYTHTDALEFLRDHLQKTGSMDSAAIRKLQTDLERITAFFSDKEAWAFCMGACWFDRPDVGRAMMDVSLAINGRRQQQPQRTPQLSIAPEHFGAT